MDAEEQVLETFPEAEAREIPPILLHGMIIRLKSAIGVSSPDRNSIPRNWAGGTSEQEAWSDAAGLQGCPRRSNH